ncbi:MAG: DUF2608 domain-containing protein [Bdellovibrionales bacterium]|nr:DUF2608 domain-containing protein [Bdellovibrionales bacterium]
MIFRVLGFLFFFLSLVASASQQFDIKSIDQFEQIFVELTTNYKSDEILVVMDIDNTLVTMDGELGSDQWWNWQEAMVLGSEGDDYKQRHGAVALSFDGLLSVQGFLYDVLPMHAPEPKTIELIRRLQDDGVMVIGLTSRGPEFKSPAFRELYKAGYNLLRTASPIEERDYLSMMPYNVRELQSKYGFTLRQIADYKLNKPRPAVYRDGVFFTSGQHKGALLKIWMQDRQLSPKVVIFMDDQVKNTNRVWEAFTAQYGGELFVPEVNTFRYGFLDKRVEAFNEISKQDVIQLWERVYRPVFEQQLNIMKRNLTDEVYNFEAAVDF